MSQSKSAEMRTISGFVPGNFAETGIPDIALLVISKY